MKGQQKINPILQEATNVVRNMLMLKGFFVRDIFSMEKDIVDIIAIREGLLNSERWRIRIIEPSSYGGLSTIQIKEFFRDQAMVHDLKGMIISLGPISSQAAKLIEKRRLNVYGLDWLKTNTGFDLKVK